MPPSPLGWPDAPPGMPPPEGMPPAEGEPGDPPPEEELGNPPPAVEPVEPGIAPPLGLLLPPEEPGEPERELLAEGEPPPELGMPPPLELEEGEEEGMEGPELPELFCVSQALRVKLSTATAKRLCWLKGGRLCMASSPAATRAAINKSGAMAPVNPAQDTKQITRGPSNDGDFAAATKSGA